MISSLHEHRPFRVKPIYYGHQYIDDADIEAVIRALKSDFLTCGPEIPRLEQKLCEVTHAKYAVVFSNGTAALHAMCHAAGIKAGDEVITTPMTFAASANCALYCGAKPVFADIDPATYNISPKEISAKITSKTKAVIAVDFTGQAAELQKIQEICRAHDLVFLEDAAHAIGTNYSGQPIGSIADMTAFSFHPVKTVTGGEGGAVTTNHPEFYQKLLLFRTHGITREKDLWKNPSDGPWYYEQIDLGYNYRLTDIQAALIHSQLEKLEKFSARRKEITQMYNQAFSQIPALILQQELPQSDTTRHLYLLQLRPNLLNCDRLQIFQELQEENIYCNVHYIPVYYFPYYQKLGYKKGICPHAESLYENSLTIPLYYSMTDSDVADVIEAVKKVVVRHTVLVD